jgi:hypothetical protein
LWSIDESGTLVWRDRPRNLREIARATREHSKLSEFERGYLKAKNRIEHGLTKEMMRQMVDNINLVAQPPIIVKGVDAMT